MLASKALNAASVSLQMYNFVAICPGFSISQVSTVVTIVSEHLDSAEIMYMCMLDKPRGSHGKYISPDWQYVDM